MAAAGTLVNSHKDYVFDEMSKCRYLLIGGPCRSFGCIHHNDAVLLLVILSSNANSDSYHLCDWDVINLQKDDIQSLELSKTGRSSSFRASSSRSNSSNISSLNDIDFDDEIVLKWAAVDRLPTLERLRSSLFDQNDNGKQVIDVSKLSAQERHLFIDRLIKQIENDNLRLLTKIKKRADKVGLKFPTVELRYKNLTIETECEVVNGKPLPTLWNSFKTLISDISKVPGLASQKAKISIINDVSGVIKPGRMTLLLGPPGSGKTSFLKALSGNLSKSLQVKGEVLYNGYKLEEFVPQKSAAYISQNDVHIPQMTVRETIDFAARCQGIGTRLELLIELSRREKEAGIVPDPDTDTYMKAISVEGQKTSLQTDYILKILGLDICADTLVGDAMQRGISGGQKKRLTTGEMIVGPTKPFFMDEISNGLDSSTTYQIIACLQQLAHKTDATVLISLLQPAPETFDLFDDIILMSEGKTVYHGPRDNILHFFDECGFRCPARKGAADFLQEVISRKDQAQYWHRKEQTHNYVSVDILYRKFKDSPFGKSLNEELSKPVLKTESERKAISFDAYSLSKGALFRACISREFLLMQRNSFLYIFKSVQLFSIALITCTAFFRTQMEIDSRHANYYLGALFFAVLTLIVDGLPEVAMTVGRLQVFYKQRDFYFYPAWAYTIPAAILKIPISILESLVWTSLTYYMIGYSPEASRFFRQLILLFAVHLTSLSMFRFLASIFQTLVASVAACSFATLILFLLAGFMIPPPYMPAWIKWAFWICPISYGEIGLAVNEFHAPRWQKMVSTNSTIGKQTLVSRGLDFSENYFWVSLAALFGFSIFFNVGFTLALTFLRPRGSRAIISKEKLSQIQGSQEPSSDNHNKSNSLNLFSNITPKKGKMILPFEPLTVVFQDVQYHVDTPMEMRSRGFAEKKLQLLCDITGAFRPGVLTALMGVSGAGKTTLLDVLSGRKTSGIIEGQVKIGGYAKVQETFARVSGYCEQTDTHSPQITVEESLIFSAWLRLDPQINSESKYEFVREVLETIELDEMKDALVGLPGVNGLSTEQRKRLTIAVELVANPSIIFMDEPTTGLDARSAAIVMRAVKNVVDTGRTIVCTIHQPSIDIFESFDELILLKAGGRIIYSGPLGQHSSTVIDYFEGISGISKIESNCNPATWILELTSTSSEAKLGLDFAQIYKNSALREKNEELVNSLSVPQSGSKELKFTNQYSQNGWGQFKSCLWKQRLSYWRSPSYNLTRFVYMLLTSSLIGILYWDQGRKLKDEQGMLNVIGAMYAAIIFCGVNNGSSVMPYVTTERNVLNRERFSGMYASRAYAFAQVIIEIPYIFSYSLLYVVITYPMIGYPWSIPKVLWYLYTMFCSLLQYNYLGMLLISITPNFPLAAIVVSCCYNLFNLFAGFLIPLPQIPKWWIWLYYLIPTSWTLNCMVSSQFGDVDTQINVLGESKSISEFLKDRFGYQHNHLPVVVAVMTLYPIVFASLFAYFIGRLNFQKR